MLLTVLIDAASTAADPTSGIWTALADKGLALGILGVAVYILWRRDSAMADRLEKYLGEDRARMSDTIQKNTEAFTRLEEVLDRMNARWDMTASRRTSEEARGKE